MPTEKEQRTGALMAASIAAALDHLIGAISEATAITGQPFDAWRERLITHRLGLEQLQREISP